SPIDRERRCRTGEHVDDEDVVHDHGHAVRARFSCPDHVPTIRRFVAAVGTGSSSRREDVMTSTSDLSRPVRLPRRSRQGVVMGMDGVQPAVAAAAGSVGLICINRFGPPGLLYGAPLYLLLGVTALTSIHGVSTPRMAGLWLMKQTRHAMGA